MNVLLIDNHDSFTFNLVDAFRCLGARVAVQRNTIGPDEALALAQRRDALIVLSPGPGGPVDAGSCLALIALARRAEVPLFGVCLGHQAIVMEAGGVVAVVPPMHGKASRIAHDGAGMFAGLPPEIDIGRYHSLATPAPPPRFRVHAALDGLAMAISDREARQWGVQFHPESILTPQGDAILANLLREAAYTE